VLRLLATFVLHLKEEACYWFNSNLASFAPNFSWTCLKQRFLTHYAYHMVLLEMKANTPIVVNK
jgi:hypothetical protein